MSLLSRNAPMPPRLQEERARQVLAKTPKDKFHDDIEKLLTGASESSP